MKLFLDVTDIPISALNRFVENNNLTEFAFDRERNRILVQMCEIKFRKVLA